MSLVKNPPWWEPLRWWGTARCLGPISSPSVAALPTFVQHPEHCHGHISCLQQLHGIWEIKIKLGKSYWVLSGQMLGKDWWVCREAAERWERVSQSLEQWFWVVSGWLEKRVRSWMKRGICAAWIMFFEALCHYCILASFQWYHCVLILIKK